MPAKTIRRLCLRILIAQLTIALFITWREGIILSHIAPASYQATSGNSPVDQLVQVVEERPSTPVPKRDSMLRPPQVALVTAAARGNVDDVRRALEHGAAINGQGPGGYTALLVAAAQGHLETVQYLVANNADINAQGRNGATALIAAARRWQKEVALFLLDHGADVHARTHFHVTALLAVLSGEGFMYDPTLNVYEPKQFAITHETTPQVLNLVTLLLDRGADVNVRNRKGKTPLRLAIESGNRELVQLFLQRRAQVDSKAKDGQTPLMVARAQNLTEIIQLLQQAGAH